MAERKPLVLGPAGNLEELPAGDTLPGAVPGGDKPYVKVVNLFGGRLPYFNTLMFTHAETTILRVDSVVVGPAMTWSLRYAPTRDATSYTTVFATDQVTNSTSTGQSFTTFANAVIPAGNWVWLTCVSTAGSVTEFHASIYHT